MIRINHLTKAFDQHKAVDDLSFSVGQGEVLGFLGPNGAGKSTTMKIITGFLAPTSGSVSVDGHDIREDPMAVKSLIGYLPEGAPCYPDMTTLEFLGFIADIRGLEGEERQRRLDYVFDEVGLQPVRDQSIDTLSKGFKRRVGLAQAILHDPRVLILDEPTDGLDPNQKQHVRELIKGLARDKIIIISTHILEEVTAVCTRAIIISEGRIVADGTPRELEARSRYHQAVQVAFTEDFDLPAVLAEQAPGMEIERDELSPCRYTIVTPDGEPIFNRVVELSQQGRWPVAEFHVMRGQLEDYFRNITRESRQATGTEG